MTTTDTHPTGPGTTALVHKKNAEGAITIDAYTGVITTPNDERPDWADGLSTALLAERHGYYTSRLGTERYTQDMKMPLAFAYEDLGWLAVDEEGEATELDADAEHRMEAISEILGVSRDEAAFDDVERSHNLNGWKTSAEVEMTMERERSQEDVGAFEKAKDAGFNEERRTATGG